MTSITAQQIKLDLELVPKENRLDIEKCNGRISRGLKLKEETFQFVLDALSLTPCHPAFVITADVPEVSIDILQICPKIEDQDFDALPSEEDIVSFLRELSHIRIISSLNDIVIDQMHQPWRNFAALINKSLSGKTTALDKLCLSRAHILWGMYFQKNVDYESKAYKTYLGYATGTVHPKVARIFKKSSPSKKHSVPVPADEEPVQKGKRVKRSAKKSSTTPTTGIIIKEPHVETQSKRKEMLDVTRGKGIDLISKVVLTEEARMKEITPSVTNEGTGDKPGVPDVTKDNSTESEFESWGNDDDDSNNEEGSDEDRGMDSNDVQDKKAYIRTTDAQPEKENLEITQEQVVEDAHVKITKKADVPVTSSSPSSDLASKFLNFLDISLADIEIVCTLDVHVNHEVPRIHTSTLLAVPVLVIPEASPVYTNIPQSSQTFTTPPPQSTPTPLPTTETTNIHPSNLDFALVFRFNDRVTALEKAVDELKNDPRHTQVITLVDDQLDTRIGATREEFVNFLSASLTDRITEQVRNQLPQILPEEVSNFAPPVIEKMIQESLNQVNLANASSQPQSSYESATTLTDFELKKILIDKINSNESYLTAPEHQECFDGLVKYYNLKKDFFSSYDVYLLKRRQDDKDKDEGPSAGLDRRTKSQSKSFGKFVHVEEPEFKVGDTDTPQVKKGIGNEDKIRQKGPMQNWLMTLATSTFTGKSLKEFDKLMSTPIEFSSYILNGLKIENLTQEILLGPAFRLLKGTRSNYAELEYDFEECYKALLEKLDWENPEGGDYPFDLSKPFPLITRDDVADFATALRMFTRDLRKRHPYNPYKNPQGFIYVDDYERNRLMRSDELYKFSDDTLTRLLSLLEDITKNIDMGYFPKRRLSTLEKKKAHFMIKDINKLLKERRMMRSLEKFIGGRLYETDLRLLQRTI
nr:hypothetical protein [Tanacetum cinerariifolium]